MEKQLRNLLLLFVTVLLLLTACTIANPKLSGAGNDAIERALKRDITLSKRANRQKKQFVPSAVQKALMPEINLPNNAQLPTTSETSADQQRFNIAVNNVPANGFFMGLVKGTKYNMTVSPEVKGMISLDLKNVTIPEIMEAAHQTYGFEYERTPYGYRVSPRELETRVFNVNYLAIERTGKSNTSFASGELTRTSKEVSSPGVMGSSTQSQISPGTAIETTSKMQFWQDLKDNLTTIIGTKENRAVVVNPQSGTVIVRAYPDELRSVASYLDNIQNSVNRQVIIEAQILEVQLDAAFQTGINWRALGIGQGTIDGTSPINPSAGLPETGTIPNDFSSIFTLLITDPNHNTIEALIRLLSTQGRVNVLSSPRLSTTNNQKAVIKVGNEHFFVTDVTSNTTTGSATTTSQNIQLTPFFSGIALDVTPQITDEGEVTLHIHPVVSTVTRDQQQFTVNSQEQNLPLAQSSIREADSIVHAKNGQLIVIGGLMQNSGTDYSASTPGTEHLGFFSALFKNTNKSSRKFELVILLRPTITSAPCTWTSILKQELKRVQEMKGDFRYSIVRSSSIKNTK